MALRMVVFDLDGTLVQARQAAWEVFAETDREFGLGVGSAERFFALFRGNIFRAIDELCGNREQAVKVREHFLRSLRDQYAPHPVPGVADVVRSLAAHYALAIISSNAMEAIRRILTTAGLAHCFAHVFSGDVGEDKATCIRRMAADPAYANGRRCAPDYVEETARPGDLLLVTDTVGDVLEARSCGVRVIGVAWGMHAERDLLQAGAEFVALWPQELLARLLPDGSCEDGCCDCDAGACLLPQGTVAGGPDATARARAAAELRRARRVAVATACRCRDEPGPSRRQGVAAVTAHPASRDPPTVTVTPAPVDPLLLSALVRVARPDARAPRGQHSKGTA